MSYDVSLIAAATPPCPTCNRKYDDDGDYFWRNYTCNTSVMWKTAGCDLRAYHGKRASDLAESLGPAIEEMKANPETYKAFNAPNGWGDYEGTLAFLEAILEACELHPNLEVHIWA